MNSTHSVEVFRIDKLHKHPNADKLSIVRFGGYQCVVATKDWNEGDLAGYVPPDSLVPVAHPEFAWLVNLGRTLHNVNGKEYHRVTAVRLRKEPSMGILVKAPEGSTVGSDLAAHFGVLHYDPPVREQAGAHGKKTYGSQAEKKPTCNPPVYDIDSIRKFTDILKPGEPIYVTEKIHGSNARYTAEDRGFFSFSARNWSVSVRFGSTVFTWGRGRGFKRTKLPEYARYMRVGSRTQWKRPDPNDIWWRALTPEIAAFCKNNPGCTLYGEVYGDVQDLDYGLGVGEVRFVAFDVLMQDTDLRGATCWKDAPAFFAVMERYGIPTVPIVAIEGFDLDSVLRMAEGPTILGNGKHVREGVVVRPRMERHDPRFGRVILKAVGQGYYERA